MARVAGQTGQPRMEGIEVLELHFLKPMLEVCCCMAVVFGG